MAYKHDDKSSGQLIRSADWNLMGHEIERLETDKVNRAGDTIRGDLAVTVKAQLGSLVVTGNASIAGVFTVSGTSSSIAGKLGIGTTSPSAQLSLGEWNSGNAGFSGNQATQLLLSGAHNQGANNGRQGQTTYKLKIEGYDNDGSTVYPIYCRDENELVDFWIKNRPSERELPTLYFAGNVGIGTTNPQAKLEVAGAGTTNAEVLRVVNSSTDYLSIQFASAGAGHLQLISWSNGWNINTKTAGKHLYLNRDAAETSDVYIGRANQEICVKGKGNVGIGTADPKAKLQIAGGAIMPSTGNNETSGIMFPKDPFGVTGGDAAWIRYHNTRGGGKGTLEIGISNQADDHIVLNPSGNVGIGVLDPQCKLDVNGNVKVSGSLTSGSLTSGSLTVTSDASINNGSLSFGTTVRQMLNLWRTDYGIGIQSGTQYFRTAKNFAWYKGGSHNDSELNAGGGDIQMAIRDGNVGIGTTTPRGKLHISGDIVLGVDENNKKFLIHSRTGANGDHLQITHDKSDGNWDWGKGIVLKRAQAAPAVETRVGIGTDSPQAKLHVAGDVRAESLNVAGNVGIGTTTPKAKLHVSIGYGGTAAAAAQFQTENCGAPCGQPAWTEAIRLWNANGNGRVGLGLVKGGNGDLSNVPNVYLGTFDGNDNRFRIATKDKNELTDRMVIDGANVEVSGIIRAVDFVRNSDERMKTDVEELHYGLNEILRLRPVSFNWKDIPNMHKSLGLVAQEVQPHIREVVYEEKDGTLGSRFGISYIDLIPVLINAIKDLTNRLGDLEKNVAAHSTPSIGMG